jgi:acyl carrier protein
MAPKVLGSWHLHRLTEEMDLDFFVMCSSASAVFGMPGQGNYAAANAFMDALSEHRRTIGLPANSINWGPWSKIGMAAEMNERDTKRWETLGVGQIEPDAGIAALEMALDMNVEQLLVLPIDWSVLTRTKRDLTRQPLLKEIVAQYDQLRPGEQRPESADFLARLQKANPADQYEMLSEHVREQVSAVLGLKTTDYFSANEGFSDLGMDSLMSVELSNRLKYSFKKNFPSTMAFEYPSLDLLTEHLAADFLDMSDQPTDRQANEQKTPLGKDDALPSVDELDDDLVENLLMDELDNAGY